MSKDIADIHIIDDTDLDPDLDLHAPKIDATVDMTNLSPEDKLAILRGEERSTPIPSLPGPRRPMVPMSPEEREEKKAQLEDFRKRLKEAKESKPN